LAFLIPLYIHESNTLVEIQGVVKMALSKKNIAAEFARRATQFHSNEEPMKIHLWGLFNWGEVSPYIKTGEIVPNAGFHKENRTIWCCDM